MVSCFLVAILSKEILFSTSVYKRDCLLVAENELIWFLEKIISEEKHQVDKETKA